MRALIFLLCLVAINVQAETVKITIIEDHLSNYQQLVGDGGCKAIRDYSVFEQQDGAVYAVLVCMILAEHDLDHLIEMITVPNYRRGLWMVAQGQVDMTVIPLTINDYTQPLLDSGAIRASLPLALKGDQSFGFYALASNTKAHAASSFEELRQLHPVMPYSWAYPAKLIEKDFNVSVQLVKTNRVFEFLQSGRADYTVIRLQGGESSGYTITRNGIELKPIGQFKAVLNMETYFMVSTKSSSADLLYELLQKGLKQMRQDGRLSKLLYTADLINSPSKKWVTIYQTPDR